MDYPRHHSHHHEGREEDYPPPPPSFSGPHGGPPPPFAGGPHGPPPPSFPGYNEPPPPAFHGYNEPPPPFPPPPQATNAHVYHSGGDHSYRTPGYGAPPPPSAQFSDFPPPGPGAYSSVPPVSHVSHETEPHHHRPHLPSFMHHHTDHQTTLNKSTVRVYSKAEPNYSLTIRDGRVILARTDTADPFQHWMKDEKFSTRVKDEEGFPSFALVNKATGQAMKHSIGATHPVQLTPYNPDVMDESVLWTESRDLGDGYRTLRMVNNIKLNVDALNGDKNHGGVHDGTTIVLWEWKKGENQRWKIIPY